jgi:hypothetical protein
VSNTIPIIAIAVSAMLRVVVEKYDGIPSMETGRSMYGVRTSSKSAVAATTRKPNNDCWECTGPKGLRPLTISNPPIENSAVRRIVIDASIS